jgi:hypothetical protein
VSLRGSGEGRVLLAELRNRGALMLDERRVREQAAKEIERLVEVARLAKLAIYGALGGDEGGVDAVGVLGAIEEVLDWYGRGTS